MRTKLFTLALGFVVLAAVFLTGCNSSKEGKSGKGDPVTIEYWYPNAETQGGKTVTELINQFNESQDKIVVKGVYNPGMYQGLMQNLQSAVAAGNSPAVVQIGWSYREYFSNNFQYTEPQTIIEKYFPDDKDYVKEKFLDNVLELAVNNDGSQVGLPYSLSVPILYLNMDILNEAGIKTSELNTWEEVAKASEKITEVTGKKGLYIAEPTDTWNVQQMLESNGGKTIADGKAAFASEEGVETYKFYQDLIKGGSALHIGIDEGQQAFVSGDVGMAHLTVAQRKNVTENGNFEAMAVPSPTFEGKELKVPAGGSLLAITAEKEEEQKGAWEFMKFLYEPDSVAAWTQGTGYLPETTDATENKELVALIEEDNMMAAAYATIENLIPWAPFPGNSGLEAEQMLIDMRDRILGGGDVEKDLKETQEAINKLTK
ncbi:multiple sugar transport system substrate-binding protein/sn-glycerol 3-phosphate transport system substrate-binding protein [Bacillus thermophilus]|uniref:Multiple sugar transport system substrate-binding protein/sn-glycerol 3-phosphate transport system substrate-binding protein n=2 Tax=Siminovitchia thermophila TaxID=1245522 RepID=A0ABS2R696_9BACI|nr:multiple sugar transport system substrate-binding protein/sn-glycerol 3-phosphate transport system substrate-binding protein [Siminovitchia thermophila]